MEILVAEVERHQRDPEGFPLQKIADVYRVERTQLQRIRDALDKKEIPFKTRPSSSTREPFEGRRMNPPAGEAAFEPEPADISERGRQRMKKFEKEQEVRKDMVALKPFERIRDLLLRTDPGKPITEEVAHEMLKLLAGSTQAEGTIIKALEASRAIARDSGRGTELGPPPPMTDGEKVIAASDILRAIGMECAIRAVGRAYGAYLSVRRKRGKKDEGETDEGEDAVLGNG